jgi:hypothetical protein
MSRVKASILGAGLLFLGPIFGLAVGSFLFETYPGRPDVVLTATSKDILWVVSLALGVAGVWMLPIPRLSRFVIIPPYLVGMSFACSAMFAALACGTIAGCR